VTPRADGLEAVEARLWTLLEPYQAELEAASIYGVPTLRWPQAKAHDYFAGVKAGKRAVSLYLLVADTYPDALEDTPAVLLRRRTGKATFSFSSLDEELALHLDALLARLYARYRADHAADPRQTRRRAGRVRGDG
jgi:hypothetical protein